MNVVGLFIGHRFGKPARHVDYNFTDESPVRFGRELVSLARQGSCRGDLVGFLHGLIHSHQYPSLSENRVVLPSAPSCALPPTSSRVPAAAIVSCLDCL